MKYSNRFVIITALFVTCLLTANIIGPSLGRRFSNTARRLILFPFSYIFGIFWRKFTAIKHPARWSGWVSLQSHLCRLCLAGRAFCHQPLIGPGKAPTTPFSATPPVTAASFLGYSSVNLLTPSFSKMKILTKGRWLWSAPSVQPSSEKAWIPLFLLSGGVISALPSFTPWMILWHWRQKWLSKSSSHRWPISSSVTWRKMSQLTPTTIKLTLILYIYMKEGRRTMNIRFVGAHNSESKDVRPVCLLIDDVLAVDAGGLISGLSFSEQLAIQALLVNTITTTTLKTSRWWACPSTLKRPGSISIP